MKLLIRLHKNKIYVDDYVLTDYDDLVDEQIIINSEIILGLIRKLASKV